MADHKELPAIYQDGIVLEPLSDDMKKGLELAAFICRMYGDGKVWAETILHYGEQQRARWWIVKQQRDRESRERQIAEELGVSPNHPMIREAVEIERGERNRDGSWIG